MKSILQSVITSYRSFISIILFIGILLIMGCGTFKTESNPQDFEELKNLTEDREFVINFQWAQPSGGSMIDLLSNPNHIIFKGDEVDIFLPFFGVRHRGGGYGSNTGGIKYEGEISNLKIFQNPSKQNILMTFDGQQDSEILQFNITLYENGKAHASVSSSDRSTIGYQGGEVKKTSKKTEE